MADTPIQLPTGWRALPDSRGIVIDAVNAEGRHQVSITVCEDVRGFALGICGVRRPEGGSKYVGRGWKPRLYADAVAALQEVVAREAAIHAQALAKSEPHDH